MRQKILNTLLGLSTLTFATFGNSLLASAGQEGMASWYGPGFSGSPTASGEIFNPEGLTAANNTLPLGTRVRVTNLNNGASVVVRVNDRMGHPDRVIDLSTAAARVIGLIDAGVAPVSLEVLGR
jgi:rare lipoprotein A